MSTDKLWAPWRVKYIRVLAKKQKGCVFCKIFRSKNDTKNYIFARTKHSFAVLNIFPYNNGHVLVLPNRHVAELHDLTSEEKKDLFALFESTKALIDKTLHPQGYNIGMNLGKIAGAGFPGHLHIHVVPRWSGDVNFMPVVSDTKVVSQSLSELHKRLCRAQRSKKAKKRTKKK